MLTRIKAHRPTPAFILAAVALFVAMGGTAYALSSGEVRSRHILNDAVTSADIKGGGGKTGDIKNRDVNAFLAVSKGFATVQPGASPKILNYGGQQTATPGQGVASNANGVTVKRVYGFPGIYDVTFTANPGTGKFKGVQNISDLAVSVSGHAAPHPFADQTPPVATWIPSQSSATQDSIRLRILIRKLPSGNDAASLIDRNFTVLFYLNTQVPVF